MYGICDVRIFFLEIPSPSTDFVLNFEHFFPIIR